MPVPCDFITKEKINEFLNKRVKEVAKPEEIRAEELTLKKFGLVAAGFRPGEEHRGPADGAGGRLLRLRQEEAVHHRDRRPSDTQEPVLAHELSHALADQSFNLAKFIRQGRKSDDGATARLAVMEGQATWLMSEFLAQQERAVAEETRRRWWP